MHRLEAARATTMAKILAKRKAGKVPVPTPMPSPVLRANDFLESATDTQFEAATHATKSEFRNMPAALMAALGSVIFRPGHRLGFNTLDVIFIVFTFCAGNPTGFSFHHSSGPPLQCFRG